MISFYSRVHYSSLFYCPMWCYINPVVGQLRQHRYITFLSIMCTDMEKVIRMVSTFGGKAPHMVFIGEIFKSPDLIAVV